MRPFLALLILTMAAMGCKNRINNSDSLNQSTLKELGGGYAFDLFDESGQRAYHGTFNIEPSENDVMTGSWQMENGQSGNVFCTQENGLLYIHLDIPGLLPQEYLLIGTSDGVSIRGQWRFNVEVFSNDVTGAFEARLLDK